MKIFFLIPSLDFGGAERQLVELAKGLHKKKHEIKIFVFYSGGKLESDVIENNIEIIDLKIKGRHHILLLYLKLIKIFFKDRPDIFHGYLGTPNIIAVTMKFLFPKIKVIWGIRSSKRVLNTIGNKLVDKLQTHLSKFTDLIIVNSRSGYNFLEEKGLPISKIRIIENGIDTELYKPNIKARFEIRKELGIENKLVIGIVGRVVPVKNHELFIKAAALFKEKYDSDNKVVFLCIGNGNSKYIEDLISLQYKLGLKDSIIWSPSREDINKVYNSLDILTSTSLTEGFSNVIGEALATDLPCVVTDVGDSAKLVGINGSIIKDFDYNTLAKEWHKVIQDIENFEDVKEQKFKRRKRIIENFSLNHMVNKTERELKRIGNEL